MVEPFYKNESTALYCADNLAIMREMPAESVDIVITSPPYNMGNTTGGGMKQYKGHYSAGGGMKVRGGSSKWKGAALANGYESFNDNMPHTEYVAWQKEVLLECWRLLPPTGAIFYNHKQRILDGECVTPLAYNPGLPIRQIITWARSGGINFNICFYLPTSEWIVIFAKPDFRLKDKSASGIGDVWAFSQESNNPHPAPFPLELPKRILVSTTGKVILDPFAGSCTTGVACVLTNREFIGIDIEKYYLDYGIARMTRAKGIACDYPINPNVAPKGLTLFD